MLLITLATSGCSLFQTSDRTEPPDTLPLLAPIGPARRIVQSITVQWQGRQDNFLCILELDQQHIAIAGITEQGMSLFNLKYDDKKLDMTYSPFISAKLPPEMIVKDLQLAYWPVPMLQKKLPAPWRLTSVNRQRHLYADNQLVEEVSYLQADSIWPKKVELINHRYHYKLLINTVSYEIIPE